MLQTFLHASACIPSSSPELRNKKQIEPVQDLMLVESSDIAAKFSYLGRKVTRGTKIVETPGLTERLYIKLANYL